MLKFQVTSLLALKRCMLGTIVHPKATIFAIAGPIIIGMGCIIEEGAIIVNRYVLNFQLHPIRAYIYVLHQEKRGYANWRREPFRNWLSCVFLFLKNEDNNIMLWIITSGVESPTVGNFNTISTRSRVHHTVRIASYCVIGAGCLLVPTEDQELDDYTVVYGSAAEQRTWSGRGKVQELDLRRKHAEYLREMLPKFNRLRRGDGT